MKNPGDRLHGLICGVMLLGGSVLLPLLIHGGHAGRSVICTLVVIGVFAFFVKG